MALGKVAARFSDGKLLRGQRLPCYFLLQPGHLSETKEEGLHASGDGVTLRPTRKPSVSRFT